MKEHSLSNILDRFHDLGDEIAYIQHSDYSLRRWSYRKVAEVSRQFSRLLNARGIEPNDRVVIWGENSAQWVAAFFGSVTCGIVAVPMDQTTPGDFVAKICAQLNPSLIVRSRHTPDLDLGIPVLFLDELEGCVAAYSNAPFSNGPVCRTDIAEIVFTSGATANPKGVVITHGNILSNIEPLEKEILKYSKYEKVVHPLRFMTLLPLSHMFGQYLGLFLPQILGGTVLLQNSLKPSDILRTIKRQRISVMVGVPRILDSLKETLERDIDSKGQRYDFEKKFKRAEKSRFLKRWWMFRRLHFTLGWKFIAFICGGAKLGEGTESFWRTLGFAVIQGYGLTETTSLISVNHPFKISGGTVGKILAGREVRLSENGEILVRGNNVAKSYLRNAILMPVSDGDGWFPTGDLGALDDEGNLVFRGRKKNVIVTAEGMNVYPEDIESVLKKQTEIRDCVVLGLEREGNPEICAVLLLYNREQPADNIINRVNRSLTGYQHIRRWCVWPEEDFPRTSTQKPKIQEVRDFAASKLFDISETNPPKGIFTDLIRQVTGRSFKNIDRNSNLSTDLDLSSIERVLLLGALEDRFQVDLSEKLFSEASTLGDLEALVESPSLRRSDYTYPHWAQKKSIRCLRNALYYLLIWPLNNLLARPKVYGREYLEKAGESAIFISNHVTRIDAVFILAALPGRYRHRMAVAMLGELLQEMRNPDPSAPLWKRTVSRIQYLFLTVLFNVFPLPQKTGFRESFRFAGESVDQRNSLLIFPEGGRTKDGKIAPFRAGIGLLAKDLNIPVVPMRIFGLYALKKSGRRHARSGEVSVVIGTPLSIFGDKDPVEIAKELQSRVERLSVPITSSN